MNIHDWRFEKHKEKLCKMTRITELQNWIYSNCFLWHDDAKQLDVLEKCIEFAVEHGKPIIFTTAIIVERKETNISFMIFWDSEIRFIDCS